MQTYEDFIKEVTAVCIDKKFYNMEVRNEIIRILDYYYNLSTVQLLLLIPQVLIKTGRENSLEFTLEVVNRFCRLKTPNFTFKVAFKFYFICTFSEYV